VLLESTGDRTLIMSLAVMGFVNWCDSGDFGEMLKWSQTVVDLADGDPAKGAGFGVGSPLAAALAARSVARWWLGRSGWRDDLRDALSTARGRDPTTLSFVVAWTYGIGILYGVLRADDSAERAIEEAVQTAQRASNDHALCLAEYALASTLLARADAATRQRGLEMMVQISKAWADHGPFLVPVADVLARREQAKRGDREASLVVMREDLHELREAERLGAAVNCTLLLVETLLERGTAADVREAEDAVEWLAKRADQGSAILDITLLRMRALLSRAHGDEYAYRDLASRYRAMAESLGFQGHIDSAEVMTDGDPPLRPGQPG
jgi:hypothetical protein